MASHQLISTKKNSRFQMLLWSLFVASHFITAKAFLQAKETRSSYPLFSTASYHGDMGFFFPLPSREYSMEPLMQVSIADPQTSTTTTTTRSKWSRFFSFLQARGRRDTTTTASAAKQDNTVSNTKPNKKQEQRQESNDHDNIQCFIVNYDAVQNENAVAEIYCTSDVEEFAWYHGLSVDELVNTEDMPSLALDFSECVQGASHRGTPEWECKPEATDSKNDDEGDNKKDWSNFGI